MGNINYNTDITLQKINPDKTIVLHGYERLTLNNNNIELKDRNDKKHIFQKNG